MDNFILIYYLFRTMGEQLKCKYASFYQHMDYYTNVLCTEHVFHICFVTVNTL